MKKFKGFTNSESVTGLPDSFFRQMLKEIGEVDEPKVTIYASVALCATWRGHSRP